MSVSSATDLYMLPVLSKAPRRQAMTRWHALRPFLSDRRGRGGRHRSFAQINRVADINAPDTITDDVLVTARESLIIGAA